MASLNPSSDISSFINTVYEAAILVARDNNVMTGLVRTFNDRTGVAVRSNQQYGGATMNAIAETDDLTGQAFDLGQAMATKIETDLLSVFSSFTGGTIGAAGSAISWGHVFAMESILRAKKAPGPYFLVMHPYQWHALAKASQVAGASQTIAPSIAEQVNTSFWVRTVANVNIFVTSNISVDGSDDAVCGMFSQDALALDMRRAPRIEPERDASRRGYELNMSAIYAKGVWRPTFGVKGTFDASVPTS